ncbi:hypothetical protein Tco_0883670 [Tanacetum coccineum]
MKSGPSGSSGPNTRSKKKKNIGTNDGSQACSSVLDAHDKGDLCPWVLYVAKDKHTKIWLVRTHRDTHTCLQSREIKHCTYKFLSEKIFDQVRVNMEIPVKAIQDQLQRNLEVQISMSKAFRAKAKAEREIRGDHVLQYSMLRDYVVELQSTNLNTIVKIAVERNTDPSLPTRVFQRIYGSFPGQVLTAVGLDSNNRIYPLVYALVEAEKASGSASRQAQQTEPAVGQDGSGRSGVGAVIGLSLVKVVQVVQVVHVVQMLAVKVHPILDGQKEEYKHKELVHKKELPVNLQVNLLPVLKCH